MSLSELDQIEMGPHGKHHLSKKKESSKSVHPVKSSEVYFNIQGALAPVFTPVADDGKLDLDVIPGYMQYLVNHGIRGILVGGTTGEFGTLSLNERKAVLDAWLAEAKPLDVKVIAQVGGVPLPEVLEMAVYAETIEADAILTLPELYYKPTSTAQLVSYLEMVSKAAPSLPLIYYHFPMMSGVEVNPKEFFSMASSAIPNFKGMKADLDVAIKINDLLAEDQRIFIGNHVLAPPVLLGHESSIATVTNLFPLLVLDLIQAATRANLTLTRKLQAKLNNLVDAVTAQGEFLPAMKAAMAIVTGINVGPPRKPMAPLHQQRVEDIETALQTLGYFDVV